MAGEHRDPADEDETFSREAEPPKKGKYDWQPLARKRAAELNRFDAKAQAERDGVIEMVNLMNQTHEARI